MKINSLNQITYENDHTNLIKSLWNWIEHTKLALEIGMPFLFGKMGIGRLKKKNSHDNEKWAKSH